MSKLEILEEYQRLMLLASNFVAPGARRPMHIINSVSAPLAGPLASLFEVLDDDSRGFLPVARTVGASSARSRDEQDISARVVVI